MFFGSRLNRLATSIRRGISKYSVGSNNPGLVFDFIDNFYQKDKNQTVNFDGAITHVRNGNAVMTDGYGPELVTNGGFDSDSDWTKGTGWSISDGKAVSAGHSSHSSISQSYSFTSGKVYEVTYTITNYGSGNFSAQLSGGGTVTGTIRSSNGTYTELLTATANHTSINIRSNDGNGIGSIDNVSVREMPVLKWAPHNLLRYSEDFSNPAWAKLSGASVTANSVTAPDGTLTADTFVFDGTVDGRIEQNVTETATKTIGVWLRTASGTQTVKIGFSSANLLDVTVTSEWQLFTYEQTASGTYARVRCDDAATIYAWGAHAFRSDLGGMVDNPDRGASYVPTAAVASGDSIVVDGGFDDPTNWTLGTGWSISGSKLVGSNVGGTAYAQQTLNTTSGAYVVTFDVTDYTSGNLDVFLGGSTSAVVSITGAGSYSVVITGVGTYTATTLRLSAGNANFTGSVDNLVVRKSLVDPSAARYLPRIGHHVYNGSAWVNEGLLAESELRSNLWLYSNDPTNAAWSFANDVTRPTSASSTGPDGQTSGYFLKPTTSSNSHYVAQSFSLTSGVDYTLSFYLKENGYRYAQIIIGGAYSADDYANFDLQDGVIGDVSTTATATIQDVGNGWFRCSCTFPADATATGNSGIGFIQSLTDGRVPSFSGDGTSGIDVYGAQLEVGDNNASAPTPSSLIPTSGQQATRQAESFTIPSANLPWPPEVLSGVEEITSGTFDTAAALDDFGTTGTVTYDTATQSARLQPNSELTQFLDGTDNVAGSYKISWNQTLVSGTRTRLLARNHPNTLYISTAYFSGSGEKSIVVTTTDGVMFRISSDNSEALIDNISVQKVEDKAVSIAAEGRMTYADEDIGESNLGGQGNVVWYLWKEDASNYAEAILKTASTRTGQAFFHQERVNVEDSSAGPNNSYSPDILVPYNIAGRHGSTFINGATDGVALTADTTPTALPDLSSSDLELAQTYMGTISEFRVWDKDIGDAGLVEATNPSLEPSLSLTFEGTGTTSFTVSDWSE